MPGADRRVAGAPGRRLLSTITLSFVFALGGGPGAAAPAWALSPLKPICGVAGLLSGIAGKACTVVQKGAQLLSGGKKPLGSQAAGAAKTAVGIGSSAGAKAAAVAGLAAVVAWVAGGAKVALSLSGRLIDHTTRPQLQTTWFSATYWRVAGIAAVLTLPFLFAAAVHALLRSDLTLLVRSALGYLPISLLAVSVAAPITMLLLAVCDAMSAAITSASAGAGTRFLAGLGGFSGGLSLYTRSPFVTFFVGLLLVAAAIVLWVEMLMRDAAIYIVVLMLPLVFAGFVWPARRVWAIRTIELLFALILSKFAVVCVLALGGSALGQGLGAGTSGILIGLVLVTLAALAPWALVALLPMAEVAAAAGGQLSGHVPGLRAADQLSPGAAEPAADWATSLPGLMSRQAEEATVPARGEPAGSETEKRHGDGQAGRGGDLRPTPDAAPVRGERSAPESSARAAENSGSAPASASPGEGEAGVAAGEQLSAETWTTMRLGPEARGDDRGGLSSEFVAPSVADAGPRIEETTAAPENHYPLRPTGAGEEGPL